MKKPPKIFSRAKVLAVGRAVLSAETQALHAAIARLDDNFARVVELIHRAPGRVVVVGLGKSGQMAHAIAATLCSLGTAAVYLHAGEAAHGDIGVVAQGDVVILVSKSGATPELIRLAPVLRALGAKLVALTGNPRSPLAEEADAILLWRAKPTRWASRRRAAPSSPSRWGTRSRWRWRRRADFPRRISRARTPPASWVAIFCCGWPT
jgi:arabinose-5-phosphate isomerase